MVSARVVEGVWEAEVEGEEGRSTLRARAIVNATGPWAGEVLSKALGLTSPDRVRLVRGSHIVTRRLFEHVALSDEFPEFLTLPAYELID